MESKKIDHLVVDAVAFLKNIELERLAENIHTVVEVVKEIKDRNTLDRLQVLPYEIQYCQPSTEDIKFVNGFAMKTGDYHVLSATDIKVIASVIALQKFYVGCDHVNMNPLHQLDTNYNSESGASNLMPGFYIPDENPDLEKLELGEDLYDKDWITEENITKVPAPDIDLPVVACLTTDFAMQNVLKQMGLGIISVDGMMIRQLRTYLLRCYGCFHVTSPGAKSVPFCPRCGNQTLKRVSVTVDSNGKQHIHINYKRPLTSKGKKFSLPLPKGGQKSVNPVLTADQEKHRIYKKQNEVDRDYISGESPFAMHNVYAQLTRNTRNHYHRRNPNESAIQTKGRRKK